MSLLKDKYILNDTGKQRRRFSTGMERDNREGKGRFDLISPFALLRLARVYEKGSKKYVDRNWEKGCDFSVFVDSMFRHLTQYMMGDDDEDHLAQLAWNAFALMHLQFTHPELDNMPKYMATIEKYMKSPKKRFDNVLKEFGDSFLGGPMARVVAKATDKMMNKMMMGKSK